MTRTARRPDDPLRAAGGRLRVVPLLHGRFEFAVEVRRVFAEHRPTHVAVELPGGLSAAYQEAVSRLPLLSVLRIEMERPAAGSDAETGPLYALIEPTDGIVEAVRLAIDHDLPVSCVDRNAARVTPVRRSFPDPHAIESIGLAAYAGPCLTTVPVHSSHAADDTTLRERTMAHHLSRLLAVPRARVLFVCGLSHVRGVLDRLDQEPAVPFGRRPRLRVAVFHLHPDSTREVLGEMPYIAARYESWRQEQTGTAAGSSWPLPRQNLHTDLIRDARAALRREGEEVSPAAVATLFRYARNCSLLERALAPDFYTLVLAARGIADDSFAWHVWNTGATYEPSASADNRAALRITLEDLDRAGRQVRFERPLRRRRRPLRLVRPRPVERRPGAWKEQWDGQGPCSFPPEDIVIEGYGRFLAHKAKGILAADQSRSEPFTTSLLDGIDFRETIRNLAHDGRIWVHQRIPVKGDVGAVVLLFDPDDAAGRYVHRMTWQGEHDQESDMALYSTPPGEQIVGPGVARCEYGGLLLTWPPGRMYLVWEDPEFAVARTPGEHLLLAGLDYASERLVVHVAPSPPRSFARQYAANRGRRIVHVPIGQLSPPALARIRTFHMLDGKQVRAYARDYVW
ncbi:MAG: hypothetical protein ACE5IK_05510 [Acidobacteriota bacterium]